MKNNSSKVPMYLCLGGFLGVGSASLVKITFGRTSLSTIMVVVGTALIVTAILMFVQRRHTKPVAASIGGLAIAVLLTACGGRGNSCVTAAEYKAATELQRKLINQIDAAMAGMEIMSRSFAADTLAGYTAKGEQALFANVVLIGFKNNDADAGQVGSCRICKDESAMPCIAQMTGDVDIKITRDGECYQLAWQ